MVNADFKEYLQEIVKAIDRIERELKEAKNDSEKFSLSQDLYKLKQTLDFSRPANEEYIAYRNRQYEHFCRKCKASNFI